MIKQKAVEILGKLVTGIILLFLGTLFVVVGVFLGFADSLLRKFDKCSLKNRFINNKYW